MSVGVEVDALALMLDGAYFGLHRFRDMNVRALEAGGPYGRGDEPAIMEMATSMPEWAEVAEAILELEAWADYWIGEASAMSPPWGLLASCAAIHVDPVISNEDVMLEAAALLRDGWRPKGWEKR